mgnify:CR=1 FL=1
MTPEPNFQKVSKGAEMTAQVNTKTNENTNRSTTVDRVTKRRLPQLSLTSVPIDIKAFGETFFLLAVDPRDGKTDYLVASLSRNLDKIRITIDGAPQINPNDVIGGKMIQVTVTGLDGRFWQTQTGAGVYFTAVAIEKVSAK